MQRLRNCAHKQPTRPAKKVASAYTYNVVKEEQNDEDGSVISCSSGKAGGARGFLTNRMAAAGFNHGHRRARHAH